MHRAYLARNTDRVRVTGTPSPGSVAPASFINTVDRVNPSTWSNFPVVDAFEMAKTWKSTVVVRAIWGCRAEVKRMRFELTTSGAPRRAAKYTVTAKGVL